MRLPWILGVALAILALPGPTPMSRADEFRVPLGSTLLRVPRGEGDSRLVVGRPLAVRADTLRVTDGRMTTAVPLRGIRRIEVSRGQSRSTGTGALIGLVSGAGLGALLGAASESDEMFSTGTNIAIGAMSFGILGTVIGGVAGHATARERWEPVPVVKVGVDSAGQLWAPLGPGQKLRVTAPLWEQGRVTAAVRDLGPDSLVLARGSGALAIPTHLIRKVEIAGSRNSHGGVGALIGLAAGFAAGAILSGASSDSDGSPLAAGVGVGAFLGMPVGWIIGLQVRTAAWEEVPLRPPPLTPLAPGGDSERADLSPGGR